MKSFLLILCILGCTALFPQGVSGSLEKAWQQFTGDVQLKHGIASLHVINARTGAVVFSKNAGIGLAPASTQKIITSVTALEILGDKFRFRTRVNYSGTLANGRLNGNILIHGSGDPSFGSWRWEETGMKKIYSGIGNAMKKAGISEVRGEISVINSNFETQQIPDGWIWQDIGNYYGAGAGHLIWHENQYDLFLKSGSQIGDPVEVAGTDPLIYAHTVQSEVTSAAKGSGDNAYIYLPLETTVATVRGTIPVNENRFRISGAMTDPAREFSLGLLASLKEQKIAVQSDNNAVTAATSGEEHKLFEQFSPSLDSIIYWFNRKSINLYGEALVKAMALGQRGLGATDTGIAVIREFWRSKGIDENALNLRDGSGLSPINRVTTNAQVSILQYAKGRDWFPAFYHALPEYNGMKMKSGTISDVKGFCGYHQSKDGTEYIFSFLVNNYSGRASALVGKMYTVLNCLK